MKTILKSILFFVFISICVNGYTQTEEPGLPDEGEVPAPAATDGLTSAADAVGKQLQGDPCSEQSYAEQVYCYTGQWLSSIIACGYGINTPQYTLCDTGQSLSQPNAAEENRLHQLNKKKCWVNPKVRPQYFDSKNANKAIKEKFAKAKKNTVLHTYKSGHQLKIAYSSPLKESNDELFVQLKITDAKGKEMARPFLISKKNRTYLFEGCYK
tara:strand:+ start:3083 stop:3718 length:636 start_codon:yes stop_codon:yes gene_type:complete